MKPDRILVPINTVTCRPEVFKRVNAFARRPGVTVILLHVLNLNIVAPDNRLYEELAQEARWYLEQLAREYLRPGTSTLFRVRLGRPVEKILAEAEAEAVDLIILPVSSRSSWRRGTPIGKRLFGWLFTGTSEKLVQRAACPLLVVQASSRFNCQEHWGRYVSDIRAGLRFLAVSSGKGCGAGLGAQDALAQRDPFHPLVG